VTGIGWGLVETVVNPLIASLYPEEKTGKLNTLHAWWPGGLVIGGLLGVAMSAAGLGWQIKLAMVILPAIAGVRLCIGVVRQLVLLGQPFEFAVLFSQVHQLVVDVLDAVACRFLGRLQRLPQQLVQLALSRVCTCPGSCCSSTSAR
jgi:MFS family permease